MGQDGTNEDKQSTRNAATPRKGKKKKRSSENVQ